jgi:tetratricopeptide (TPR) repeat protein
MKGIIESHGGTVEKFIGDAVMAVFGVPMLHEDDALRACRAATEMQAALPDIGIQCRIGVNSGEVVTGTAERLATGDAVNVAARLEQAAGPGEVLIGEETYRLVKEAVEVEAVEPLHVKGKSERVAAYRLVQVRPDAERRQLPTPMIGRERELLQLQLAYDRALDDRSCQLFTILGTAGVGKSRLAAEFLQRIQGATVVRGRCLSYGKGITYWPVVEVIKGLGATPADDYAAGIIASLPDTGETSSTPDEIAWAVRSALEEGAQDGPLVVVFDDIHWGEETFLDLIEHVADFSRDAPILLLCMARPELLEKRPGWGGGKWNATAVLLEPLGAAETDRLLDELGGVSTEMRERIRAAAEGNPLFVEEMVALIRESGGEEVTVPPTIQALLAARLDQLAPEERGVLECGAVEGRVFHRSAVQVLADDTGNLQGKLMGLVRKELVRPERAQLPGDDAYRFRHLLIRDAAYEALPKATRAELHERFAGWLEERGTDVAELDEIVGYHLEQAARYRQQLGQPSETLAEHAGERLARAGRQALWRSDVRTAHGLLERAVALLRPLRWDTYLEIDYLSSTSARSRREELAAALEDIADRAHAAGDPAGEAVARLRAASERISAGSKVPGAQLEAMALDVIPMLEAAGDHYGLVRVWEVLSELANLRSDNEEWARRAEQAINHGRYIGRPALYGIGAALGVGPRPADEALATLEPILAEYAHPNSVQWQALLLAMLGRFDEAEPEILAACERQRAQTGDLSAGSAHLGWFARLAGDHEAAAHHFRICCDAMEAWGHHAYLSTFLPELGRELVVLGRFDEAELLAQRGRQLGAEDDIATQALWRQVQARVLAHRGASDEAVTLAREAVAFSEQGDSLNQQGDALWDLAEVLVEAGRIDEAMAAFEEARARYARKKNLVMARQVDERLCALTDHNRPSERTAP